MTEHGRANVLERTLSRTTVVLEPSPPLGIWKQYFTCFTYALLCMSTGLVGAWSSPMIQVLQSNKSPVGKMDDSKIGTLQSIPQYAGMVGVALVVITLIKLGTKAAGLAEGILSFVGWLLVVFASTTTLLYIGRFLMCATVIGVDVVSAFLLSEIAEDCRRGTLIAAAMFSIGVGNLAGTALGAFCENYKVFNSICIIPCTMFLLLSFFIPESPSHFIRTDKPGEACKSYIWFREVSMESAQRYVKLMRSFKRNKFRPHIVLREKSNQRAFLILTFLIAYANFCGTNVISSYSSKIFENAEVALKPNQSALLLATVVFCAGLVGTLLVERAGRRFLSISAYIAMALGLYATTAFFIMKDRKSTPPDWLIFAGLGCFSSGFTIGVSSISQVMGAELVPAGVKGVIWMCAGSIGLITGSLTVFLYTQITSHLPYYVNFLQEAVLATVGIFIAWFLVPETRGKSLSQITAELKGEKYEPESEEA